MKNDPEKSFHLIFVFIIYSKKRKNDPCNHHQRCVPILVHLSSWAFSNRPFPSSPSRLLQNEGRCAAFDMEMIFHSHANKTHFHKEGNMHLASVWKWGFLELGSGILVCLKRFAKDEIWIYFSEKNFPLEKDQDTIWNWTAILFFTETVAFIDVTKALTNGFLDDWYSTFNPKFCFLKRGVKPLRPPKPETLD